MREQAVIRTVSATVAIASIGAALLMTMGSARAGERDVTGGLSGATVGWTQPLITDPLLRLATASSAARRVSQS